MTYTNDQYEMYSISRWMYINSMYLQQTNKDPEYGSNTDPEPQNCPAAICSPCRDCPRSPCPSCPGHRGSAGCWRWWRGRGPAPSSYPSPGRYCLYPAPSININSEYHLGPGVYTYFTIKKLPPLPGNHIHQSPPKPHNEMNFELCKSTGT